MLTGNEQIVASGISPTGAPAASFELVTTADMATYAGSVGQTKYTSASTTVSFTASVAQIVGALDCTFELTGSIAATQTLTLPSAASLAAGTRFAAPGASSRLRIINSTGGTGSWSITSSTDITLLGTMTIAATTTRDFYLTFQSLTAATLQSRGTGTP